MPLSTITRVGFDADVAHKRGESGRPAALLKRRPAQPTADVAAEPNGFVVVSEETASTAGLSILAQALAAYSES